MLEAGEDFLKPGGRCDRVAMLNIFERNVKLLPIGYGKWHVRNEGELVSSSKEATLHG